MLKTLLALFVAGLGVIGAAFAGGTGLEVGQPAPPFSLPGSDGKTYSLEGLEGKTIVIAWYPKAFTGG